MLCARPLKQEEKKKKKKIKQCKKGKMLCTYAIAQTRVEGGVHAEQGQQRALWLQSHKRIQGGGLRGLGRLKSKCELNFMLSQLCIITHDKKGFECNVHTHEQT